MTRAFVWLAALAAAGVFGTGPAQAAPQGPDGQSSNTQSPNVQGLGFKDARLGMSLGDWKQAPFPGKPNPRVQPACGANAGLGGKGLTRASADAGAAASVCAYVDRYGSTVLTEDVPWTQDLLARSPRYVFTNDRLTRIDIHVGVDAFDKVMARMKAKYGKPMRIVHDTVRTRVGPLPRVQVSWKAGDDIVRLVDPAGDLATMTISFMAAPAAVSAASAG